MVDFDRPTLIGHREAVLPDIPQLWCYASSNQVVSPANTEVTIEFDTVYMSSNQAMEDSLNTGTYRFTAPYKGIWWCNACIRWDVDLADGTWSRVSAFKNGSHDLTGMLNTQGTTGGGAELAGLMFLTTSDYVELKALSDDASATLLGGVPNIYWNMIYLGGG